MKTRITSISAFFILLIAMLAAGCGSDNATTSGTVTARTVTSPTTIGTIPVTTTTTPFDAAGSPRATSADIGTQIGLGGLTFQGAYFPERFPPGCDPELVQGCKNAKADEQIVVVKVDTTEDAWGRSSTELQKVNLTAGENFSTGCCSDVRYASSGAGRDAVHHMELVFITPAAASGFVFEYPGGPAVTFTK